ncbi:MAG: Ig-like domain repeat protein, partial [Elusimicrobiota bacterium]
MDPKSRRSRGAEATGEAGVGRWPGLFAVQPAALLLGCAILLLRAAAPASVGAVTDFYLRGSSYTGDKKPSNYRALGAGGVLWNDVHDGEKNLVADTPGSVSVSSNALINQTNSACGAPTDYVYFGIWISEPMEVQTVNSGTTFNFYVGGLDQDGIHVLAAYMYLWHEDNSAGADLAGEIDNLWDSSANVGAAAGQINFSSTTASNISVQAADRIIIELYMADYNSSRVCQGLTKNKNYVTYTNNTTPSYYNARLISGHDWDIAVNPSVTNVVNNYAGLGAKEYSFQVQGTDFYPGDLVNWRRNGTLVSGVYSTTSWMNSGLLSVTFKKSDDPDSPGILYSVPTGTITLRVSRSDNPDSGFYGEWAAAEANNFKIDPYPTSTIALPVNNSYVNSVAQSSGGAVSPAGGQFTKIDVQIKNPNNQYWTHSGWSGDETWVEGSINAANGIWTLDTSTVAFVTNVTQQYQIKTRVYDDHGGAEDVTYSPVIGFNYDDEAPSGGNVYPPDTASAPAGTSYNVFGIISGTAADNDQPRAAGGAELSIRRLEGTGGMGDWDDPNGDGTGSWITGINITDPLVWIPTATVAGSPFTWGYAMSPANLTHNARYQVKLRVLDRAGTYTVVTSSSYFVYDLYQPGPGIGERPDSIINKPSSGYLNALPVITGTARDNSRTGVDRMSYALHNVDDDDYYDAELESWVNTGGPVVLNEVAGLTPGADITWSANFPGQADMEAGKQYQIWSVSEDKSKPNPGNIEQFASTVTFTWDVGRPTSSVTSPAHLGSAGPGWTFVGNQGDSVSGVASAEFIIQDQIDGKYWRTVPGPAWQDGLPGNLPAVTLVSGSTWNYTGVDLTGRDGHLMSLYIRAYDDAGNQQNDFTVGTASITFTADESDPASDVTTPGASFVKSLATISGTVSDSYSTIAEARLTISSGSSPTYYYDGAQWTTAFTSVTVNVVGGNWTYDASGAGWREAEQFSLKVTALDAVGNQETKALADRDFFYDVSLPTSAITTIADGGFYTDITLIEGTASEAVPGQLVNVQIAIQNTNSTERWDGSAWVFSGVDLWVNATTVDTDWDYTVPGGIDWAGPSRDGKAFEIKSRAVDAANNEEGSGSGTAVITFTIDRTPPASSISAPAHNSRVKAGFTVTGSSSDANSSVAYVEYVLEDQDDAVSRYWNGTAWQTAMPPALPKVTGLGGGTWEITGVDWSAKDGHGFVLYTKATDGIGNVQTDFSVPAASRTFTYDVTGPDSFVQYPAANSWARNLATISGTADSDADYVDLWIVRVDTTNPSNELEWWDGGQWQPAEVSTRAHGVSWSYQISVSTFIDTKRYKIKSQATDTAGNTGAQTFGNIFWYDVSLPTVTINLPASDGVTYKSLPMISGTGADTSPGRTGNVKFWIQRDGDLFRWDGTYNGGVAFDWVGTPVELNAVPLDGDFNQSTETWKFDIPYPTSTFSSEGGLNEYTIYVQAYDKAGGTSTIKLRSFIFDAVAPQTTILGPAHGGLYTGLSVASGTHQDVGPVSAVTQVEVNIWDQTSNKYWTGATWASSTSTVIADLWQSSWSITSADNKLPPAWPSGHTFLIRSRATDEPGNVEVLPDTGGYGNAAQFQFDDEPPTSSVSDPGADDAKGAGFTVLAGVSSDDLAVDKVEVQIVRYSVGLDPATTDYWNGTWGNFPTAYNDATGTDPWTYTLTAFTDGYQYEVRCRAVDTAGNAEATPTSGNIFTYDVNIPTATITNPPDGGAVSALDQIDGSYTDIYAGSEVDAVELSIKKNDTNQYWDGGSWA